MGDVATTVDTADAWKIVYQGYDPGQEGLRETLCTVGNGYLATRGCASEARADGVHYPGTYAAGVFNRLIDEMQGKAVDNESLVNLPNWLTVTFRIGGGAWFDIDAADLLDYRQSLDVGSGLFERTYRFRDEAGRTTRVTQRRFASMHLPHLCALEQTVEAEDWEGTIEIRSVIDAGVQNTLVDRYRNLASQHLTPATVHRPAADSVVVTVATTQSHVEIAMAARHRTTSRLTPLDEQDCAGHLVTASIGPDRDVTVEKIVLVYTGRDNALCEPAEQATRWLPRLGSFAELLDRHTLAWRHLWERFLLDVDDHVDMGRTLRAHTLHLLQTVSPHTCELDAGVPARGLHGEAYRGHIFWDEIFVFSVLNLRLPSLTRALLMYRVRRLPEAREAATAAGQAGAMYPWQSGSDGREESPRLHLNPNSGRWNPDPSARAHHIGLAIAYNVWQYYQATADVDFLADGGGEMLVEIARFWVSLAEYDDARGRYVIRGVIGPDEFHSGYPDAPYDGVDNNAYTNVMAVWTILRALDALAAIPEHVRNEMREGLALEDAELERWRAVSTAMYVPFHDGVISQFEGYDALAELDWARYRERYPNIQRMDRILEAEGDDVNRYKVSKQADVLMLFYLLSADELREVLGRLGYPLTNAQIAETTDYYLGRTSHGSTLSAVVHSWVLARRNREAAMDFFATVLDADMADIQGGTTREGIHLAAMAGSVDLAQRCFSGLEIRENRLILRPCWPEPLGPLTFRVTYRGNWLEITVRGRRAEVRADPANCSPVEIGCRESTHHLSPGGSIEVG